MARIWDVQRSDGAWDWLDFGLEPIGRLVAAALIVVGLSVMKLSTSGWE